MIVRIFSRRFLQVVGFRKTLVAGRSCRRWSRRGLRCSARNAVLVVILVVLVSGCVRSIQYLALNTISYADVPSPMLSRATGFGGVVQQLARGFGVAIGAVLLAVVAGGEHITTPISASFLC